MLQLLQRQGHNQPESDEKAPERTSHSNMRGLTGAADNLPNHTARQAQRRLAV